jgi:transposase-like protein
MWRTRDYPKELKLEAVRRVQAGERAGEVARALGVERQRVYEWCSVVGREGAAGLRRRGRPRRPEGVERKRPEKVLAGEGAASRRRIVELERKVAQQELDLDFFQQALRHVKARQQKAAGRGVLLYTKSSKR